MKAPFSWLKEYVDIDVSAKELEEKLFGCGFEVEELKQLGGEITNVVVGKVLTCEAVEGTHLFTCQVDCGEFGMKQIVTGAPNVYAGMLTPAAMDAADPEALEALLLDAADTCAAGIGADMNALAEAVLSLACAAGPCRDDMTALCVRVERG